MDFKKSFTFVFEDRDWLQKVVVIALINLIPIVGQMVVFGWMLDITRQVIRREPAGRLPGLDFGNQFVDGLKSWLINFLYVIPTILVFIPFWVAMPSSGDSDFSTIAWVTLACAAIFSVVYGIAVCLMLPAAIGNFAAKEELGAGLRIKEVFGLVRSNPGAYLLVLLGTFLVGIVAPLGTILCVVGAALTSVYGFAVLGHLYGQAYVAARPASQVEFTEIPNPS